MQTSRVILSGLVAIVLALGTTTVADASSNSFVRFDRFPINGSNFVPMDANRAYFRDAFVAGETSISGATDGETWGATATPPNSAPIQFNPVTFHKTFNDQSNCFVSLDFTVCNTTSIQIIWFAQAQCQPTGTWTYAFTNNGAQFAAPTFTLLAEVPDVPVDNQGAYLTGYDGVCYVLKNGKKVDTSCEMADAKLWEIKELGCVLVDTIMILRYHGVTVGADGKAVTPANLNDWLLANGGYSKGGGIYLDMLKQYSGGKVKMTARIDARNDERLRSSLCSSGPVIVPVVSPISRVDGKHAVVVVGRDDPVSPTTWKVNDPDGGIVTTVAAKSVYRNTYFGLRTFAGPDVEFTHNGRVIARLHSPAELLVTDGQGRRTGLDPVTGVRYDEIPEGSYAEEGIDALESGNPSVRYHELELFQPADGAYDLIVTGTAIGTYGLEIRTTDLDGASQGVESFDDVPTAPGVVHHYTITYAAAPGTPLTLGGGFDGGGQRPRDVNKFLTYANPSASRTHLPAGQMNVAVMVFFGDTIIPQTFRATLNGVDITPSFAPSAGGHHVVPLTLPRGSNVLLLSVEGTLADGRVATDTDRLVFVVP